MAKRDPDGPLLGALRTGPKDGRELLRLSGLIKRTLYHRLGRLERERRIAVFPFRQRDRWASLYALPEHAHLAAKVSKFEPLREASREIPPPRDLLENGPVQSLALRL